MKKFLVLAILFMSLTMSSQALENGKYGASVETTIDKTYGFSFTVSNGYVTVTGLPDGAKTTQNSTGNIQTYGWVNKGGIWSESQNFIFTKEIKTGKIYVYYLRVVQNEGQDPWEVVGFGEVLKY